MSGREEAAAAVQKVVESPVVETTNMSDDAQLEQFSKHALQRQLQQIAGTPIYQKKIFFGE